MSCCGQRRAQLSLSGQVAAGRNRVAATPSQVVLFEYIGKTAITVVGARTGRTYYFSQPGVRLQIDTRDVPSLAGTPNLTRLRGV